MGKGFPIPVRCFTWTFAGLLLAASVVYIVTQFQWSGIMETFRHFRAGYFFFGAVFSILSYWLIRA
jgi:hypothetical protein